MINAKRKLHSAMLVLVSGMSVALMGQTPPGAAPDQTDQPTTSEETVVMNALIITGSNIPTAADATDVPVAVLSTSDLAQTGVNNNMLEILRKKIPSFAGRSNAGNSNATNTNQNTAGGSQIALRNLDTLILINGRRIATSGINAIGGKSFVDVNQIPPNAIDHMEVLSDGASAIYGSDAIGGVVNIILKSDVNGGEIGGRFAKATGSGDYTERSGYIVGGAKSHGVNITVIGTWSKTDPLFQKDRNFIEYNPKTGTNFPGFVSGNYLNANLNTPSKTNPTGINAVANTMADLVANGTYVAAGNASIPALNVAPYQTLLLKQEMRGAVVTMDADLLKHKKLTVFGDYMYSNAKSFNQTNAFLGNLVVPGGTISGIPTVAVPVGSPYNPLTTAVTGVVVGSLNNPLQTYNNAKSNRVTLGFKGEINQDWNWEVGSVYSDSSIDQQLKNEVYVPNLNAAIAGGYDASGAAVAGGAYSKVISLSTGATVLQPALDPFARAGVSQAALDNVYGTELIKVKSTLTSSDAKIVGMPYSMPAGKLGIALGVSTRKESLKGNPDQNSYNLSTDATKHNWAPGTFFDPFNKSRTINAFYAETRAPLTSSSWSLPGVRALDLSLAGREERYSDAGKSDVPKIGLRWQPVDEQVTVRFTYSKAFTAPTLAAEFGPPSVALNTADLFFNALPQYNDPNLKGRTYYSGNGNNPSLQPSTAVSRSAGLVISPKALKGFTASFDFVNVFQKGLPGGLGATAIIQSVDALGSASPYFNSIAVGNMPGQPGSSQTLLATPGGLHNYVASPSYNKDIYLLDHFVNLGGVHERALDVSLAYELPTDSFGKFTFSTTGTYLYSFQVQDLPTSAWYEDAGYATNGKQMSGTLPKYSFYSTLDWSYRNWGVLVGNTYMPAVTDIATGQIPSVWLATHPATQVNYYTAWDAQLSYMLKKSAAHKVWKKLNGLKLTFGINNITNRMPPYAPLSQPAGSNNNNVDASQYSPLGRLIFVSADLKF